MKFRSLVQARNNFFNRSFFLLGNHFFLLLVPELCFLWDELGEALGLGEAFFVLVKNPVTHVSAVRSFLNSRCKLLTTVDVTKDSQPVTHVINLSTNCNGEDKSQDSFHFICLTLSVQEQGW